MTCSCAFISASIPICSCICPCKTAATAILVCTVGVDNTAKCDWIWAWWSWPWKACNDCPSKAFWFSLAGFVGCGCWGGGNIASILETPKASYIFLYAWYKPWGPPCICGFDWTNCNSVCAKVTRCDIEKIFGSLTGNISIRASKSCALILGSAPVTAYGYGDGFIANMSAKSLNSIFWE